MAATARSSLVEICGVLSKTTEHPAYFLAHEEVLNLALVAKDVVRGLEFASQVCVKPCQRDDFHWQPHMCDSSVKDCVDFRAVKLLTYDEAHVLSLTGVSFPDVVFYNKFFGFSTKINCEALTKLATRLSEKADNMYIIGSHALIEKRSPQLRSLKFYWGGDKQNLEYCPRLEILSIENSNLQYLSRISLCRNLEHLDIKENRLVRDIAPLRNLVNLEQLNLARLWKLQDIQPLDSLRKLKSLNLWDCRNIPSASFEVVAKLADLEDLTIGDCCWEHLRFVSGCTKLKRLDISSPCGTRSGLGPVCFFPLSKCKSLECLKATGCGDCFSLVPLKSCINLKELNLHGCTILHDDRSVFSYPDLSHFQADLTWLLAEQDAHWSTESMRKYVRNGIVTTSHDDTYGLRHNHDYMETRDKKEYIKIGTVPEKIWTSYREQHRYKPKSFWTDSDGEGMSEEELLSWSDDEYDSDSGESDDIVAYVESWGHGDMRDMYW